MGVTRRSAGCHGTVVGNPALSWRSGLHRRLRSAVPRFQNEDLPRRSLAAPVAGGNADLR